MNKKKLKILPSKNTLSILGLFFCMMCFGQVKPNLEGYYYFKENSAGVYIYDQNKFLVVGYATAVKGTIEIVNNEVEFKIDHPHSEFLLYGRKTLEDKKIIIDKNLFRNQLSLGKPSHKNNEISLYDISPEQNDYCISNQYFLPLSEIPTSLFFKTHEEFAYFPTLKNYDEFILMYMKKDEDVSFLNGQLKIENGVLVFNEYVLKQNENEDIDDLKKIIKDIEKVDSTFEEDYVYLNSNYHIVYSDKINFNNYSYDKTKNQYNSKKQLNENLATIYKFDKIKSLEKPVKNLKFHNADALKTKCLRTPYTIKKEQEDKKYRETQTPMKTLEIIPPR